MINACYYWDACCSYIYADVDISHLHTTAFKCPIPTLSAQRITGSQEMVRRLLSKLVPACSVVYCQPCRAYDYPDDYSAERKMLENSPVHST